MKKSIFSLAALLFCTQLSAAVMTLDTRGINEGLSASLKSSFYDQSTAVSSSTIDNFKGLAIGNHSIAHFSLSMDLVESKNWVFGFGLDAGHGAELYVDGNLVEKRSDDLWWRYNWNNSDVINETLSLSSTSVLELFWAENCCNGTSDARFSVDNGSTWLDLSVANVEKHAAAVSEPGTIALLALGLIGLVGARRLA